MTVIQRMTSFIMKGCRKHFLKKCGIYLVRMLTQTSPEIRVKYPSWMLMTEAELMKLSSIFFVGCWFSCAFGLHFLHYLTMHWKYLLLFWGQCLIPWLQYFQLLQVSPCCSQSQSIYFTSNWDWTKTDLLNTLCSQSVTLCTILMPAMNCLWSKSSKEVYFCSVSKPSITFPSYQVRWATFKRNFIKEWGTKLYPQEVYCYNSIIDNPSKARICP